MSWRSVLSRFGLVATAAALGLGTAVGVSAAEPTEPVSTETSAPSAETSPAETPAETPDGTPPETTPPGTPSGEPGTPSEPPSSGPPSGEPAGPARDEPSQRLAEVEVLVGFDKDSYRTGETMSIRFEIVNLLPETARDISVFQRLFDPDTIRTDFESWGGLFDGVDIPGNGSHVVTVTGRVGTPGATTGVLAGVVFDDSGSGIVEFRHEVAITPTFGRAGGIVYGDENGNARFDAGEGLPGVEVTANNQMVQEQDTYTAVTGADGSFVFPELPTVRMMVSATAPGGWLVGDLFVTIDESNSNDDLRLRGVRPLTDLTVSLEFEKDTYRAGEPARVRVRLTNKGDQNLVGIVANCNRIGNSNALTGRTEGWGALAGDGVTVRANRTLAMTVTEQVPRAAFDHGSVTVACDFSHPAVFDETNPSDHDSARVPGGFGTIEGIVGHFANGFGEPPVGVGNVRLVLTTDARCPLVAETRSDAGGRFAFSRVPAGEHQLYLLPPDGWRAAHQNPTPVGVFANQTATLVPQVEPGDATPPTLPAQPPGCDAPDGALPPQAQGRAAPKTNLADTGASVVGLLVAGLGAIAAGVGGVGFTRRRNGAKADA